MGALPLYQMTEEEYLLFEEQSEERHEYYQGETFAMAGGSVTHARIMQNTARAIGNALDGKGCEAFGSDLRIRIEAFGLYTYPDMSIVCDDLKYYKDRTDTIVNPVVIIEALSPGTESYDRGEKFAFYREIPALQEYLLILSAKMQVEHYRRQESGQWLLTVYNKPDDLVLIESVAERIPIAELYDRVEWTQAS